LVVVLRPEFTISIRTSHRSCGSTRSG
jgi:hypothetical protein